MKRHFTFVDLLVVVVASGVVGAMLSNPLLQSRQKGQLMQCANNLRMIGVSLLQYEMHFNAAPVYSGASATTTEDGKLTAANLLRLYSCGRLEGVRLQLFRCPLGVFKPDAKDAAATRATVQGDADGAKYTSYNLTTCYSMNDPANKIIVADMPFAKGCVTASAHDAEATKIDVGPNALFKDGHVTNVKSLCPVGSSEHDLSPKGNIYRVDGGEGKGKDTCILGVER